MHLLLLSDTRVLRGRFSLPFWRSLLTGGNTSLCVASLHVPGILECEANYGLGSITMNKTSGGDGIPAELFQILKDDAVKVPYSTCHQIWKTQQCP